MQNDWIIDVLADLNTFAKSNGYPGLAQQLETAASVASSELTSQEEGRVSGYARSTTKLDFRETGSSL